MISNRPESDRPMLDPDQASLPFTPDDLVPLGVGKPLAVILNSPGKDAVLPDSVFSLSVTVINKGQQSALFDVFIDPVSPPIGVWCKSLQQRLALGAEQSDEVVFELRVPVDAVPGLYRYLVVVDAHEAYPEDTPIRFSQQMQVLPIAQDVVRTSDPTFVVQPSTSSTNPMTIQPGGALQLQVQVHNRDDRVDRFRILCTDLPRLWYNVSYPRGVQGAGLVVDADSLNLNPGEQGAVILTITPPLDALAGTYVPTLRLYSENNPDLMLLDLLYLQVPPIHLLQAELRTLIGRVKRQAGLYQVRLTNQGNTRRVVRLRVNNLDEDNLCAYTLDHDLARIQPKETIGISLQAKPTKWWKRPIYGGAKIFNFSVELEDTRQLPLPIDNLPGVLVWEPRPWWQFLPVLILGILLLLGLVYLLWWYLFRTLPSPKIVQFATEDTVYSAANGDVARVGWQIDNADRLQSLRITGTAADGALLTRPEVYEFNQGIPAALQPFCVQQQTTLTCRNVRTNARKPGTYLFELSTQPISGRGSSPETIKSNPVTIQPIPQPKIIAFASTQPIYQEPSPIVVTQVAQPANQPAANSPTANPSPSPSPSPNASPSPNTDPAKVAAAVKDFGIRLNWTIANPNQLQELQLIGRSPDGAVLRPLLKFDFSQGIPKALQPLCKIQEQLVCQNVKTDARKPGDYVFELIAVPKISSDTVEAKKTELVKLLPRPPQLLEFNVNGQPAQPKYLVPLAPGEVPSFVLSWTIDASDGTKVELLPAPGSVPMKGAIPIFLSPKPGSVTVTLQVTSPSGQQVVRSLTLDTFDPAAADPAAAAAAAAAAAIANAQEQKAAEAAAAGTAGAASGLPAPTAPGTLSPIELPPQFNQR